MEGHFAYPAGAGPRPGVLVYPAAPGLGTQVKNSAEALAELGYAALGCDFYGHGRFFDDIDEATAILYPIMREQPQKMGARALGAYEALIARPEVDAGKVAAIGYCLGGAMAMALARTGAPLRAVVGFHGGIAAGEAADNAKIKASVLMCTGSEDSGAPAPVREAFLAAMAAAGVELQMSVYDGVYHSFTNPDADSYGKPDYARYDPAARAQAWSEMLELFDRTMV
jgi:dienelactone hydrolase